MRKPGEPLWKGPEIDGITFSLLSRFLVCRERFRILVVDGLRTREDFNHRIEYGNMWHACEESPEDWNEKLADYSMNLAERFPLRVSDIIKWTQVCGTQFPVYLNYWEDHHDAVAGVSLLKENPFKVPYPLPSGRTVLLRGKWDGADLIPAHTEGQRSYPDGIWVQENKTKGDINPAAIRQQLRFDLQTMIYIIALRILQESPEGPEYGLDHGPILGVRYNVVRRPLSGGRHTIVQHKPSKSKPHGEAEADYYTRLGGLIEGDPAHFFMRWKDEVTQHDVDQFKRMCLDPLLEQLCDWWNWVRFQETDPFKAGTPDGLRRGVTYQHYGIHFMMPYGVYNPLLEGGVTDVDECILTGSTSALRRTDNLFPELT